MSEYRIRAEQLQDFAATVLERAGVPADEAADAASVLVWANRRGVDTHGVRNLKTHYANKVSDGSIKGTPEFRIEYETPISARVDGDNGLGLVAGCWGMRLAMKKARESGIGMVAMRNSNHFGAAGYYPAMALAEDLIGVGLTGMMWAEGNPFGVVPTFGARAMLSTNPIAIGFPAHEEPDFLLDMATSTTPMNRVVMRQELGLPIPEGWALDAEGRSTTDPAAAKMLLPLGGTREHGSHKGYGLAVMVETLCALLSGGWTALAEPLSNGIDHAQDRDAHFFAAVRVDLFRPVDEFKRGMDAMIRALRATPRQPDQDRVYVAGEIEHHTERKRLREGIPLPANVVADLWELSRRFDVALSLEKR